MRIDHFNVHKGVVKGGGIDAVGEFTIAGTHDKHSKEINFDKQYIGQHLVQYKGHMTKKEISGRWYIGDMSDDFKISKAYEESSSSDEE